MTERSPLTRTYGGAFAGLAFALLAAVAASAWAAHAGERAWVFLLAVPIPMILAAGAALSYQRRRGGAACERERAA